MSYNYLLKTDFNNLIANRLGDINKTYWTNDEIDLYINEALLTFGAISQFWRDNVFVPIVIDKNYYNLYTDAQQNPVDFRPKIGLNFTNQNIIDFINVQLIESISNLTPNSDLYKLDTILKYIDKRVDSFLNYTGLNVGLNNYPVINNENKIEIANNLLDIINVSFKNENNIYTTLDIEDEEDLRYFNFDIFSNPNTPKYYSRLESSSNIIRLYPYPNVNGSLELLTIQGRDKSILATIGDLLLIPMNLMPYIKWGVLADMLSQDGVGQDLSRAAYCLQRWNEGLIIGSNYSSILNAYINDIPINIESLADANYFDLEWRNTTQGLDSNNQPIGYPNKIILANNNYFFTNIIPKTGYNLNLNCIINAPINSNYIEIREEYLGLLIDYIIHLSTFKEGAAPLNKTTDLLKGFLDGALNHNQRFISQGITIEYLLKKTKIQEEQISRGVQVQS
jgi:hypothetical protein